MLSDIQLYSHNLPSIVAHASNLSWFKFVKSICNHSIFQFQVVHFFQVIQCFSGSLLECSKIAGFFKYRYVYLLISIYIYIKVKLFSLLSHSPVQIGIPYPQCILYFKTIWKTYQFIYCFNSSLPVVAAIVTYAFSFTRKAIYLFSLFMPLILF